MTSLSDANIYTLDMSRRQQLAAVALYAVALVASIAVAIGTDQPGLWGLVPIVVYAGLALLGVDIVLATLGAVVSAVVLTRSTPSALGPVLIESMGSLIALLGVIILLGAGLGEVLKRTGVAEFVVLNVVRKVGLTTQLRAQLGVMLACTILAGALGTLAGSVAIVAPIVIPLLAALGFSTTATAAMFFFSGLAGLTLSPFAPITTSIYGAAQVSWIGYVLAAGLPTALVMFGVGFLAVRWNQRRTAEVFPYPPERAVDLDAVREPAPGAARTTAAFLLAFLALVVYSGVTAAGATFVPVALILLIAVTGIAARRPIGELMGAVYAGASRLLGIFFLFFLLAVLFTLVDSMGVYDGVAERFALSTLSPYVFCLVVVLIGWVGVAGAAAAQAVLVNQVFGPLAATLGVPPAAWSVVLLAVSQTDGLGPFPNPDMIGQMGLAESRSLRWQLLSSYLVLVPVVVLYALLLGIYL
ncbi:Na+/H+ antiporter family protein [Pseudonocardia hierapolitana]|uniref:Na+/H+ antiporter family protein n=1 Tax=Pseudonocardia hierapolitana TaxID=1128676 RepID=A0A561SL19_9PSEU|nr:Na+/H+ antiporter NhaC family protein [Pseudonocardia hierapolitana]TWF75557.1 Na+/H+ antiporter family protein [Pseudonocardia hierapolitana]